MRWLWFDSPKCVSCFEVFLSYDFVGDVYYYFVNLSSEHDLGEDDIYDCVPCEDDGDDIYEDIIKVEVRQPMVRSLCQRPPFLMHVTIPISCIISAHNKDTKTVSEKKAAKAAKYNA